MEIKKWRVYVAKLDPRMGTEPGKARPVVVVQTDLLNGTHPSTVVCPLTARPDAASLHRGGLGELGADRLGAGLQRRRRPLIVHIP